MEEWRKSSANPNFIDRGTRENFLSITGVCGQFTDYPNR
jgi:hypothetical protein